MVECGSTHMRSLCGGVWEYSHEREHHVVECGSTHMR